MVQQRQNLDVVGRLVGRLTCWSLIFCKFIVDASKFSVGPLHPVSRLLACSYGFHSAENLDCSLVGAFDTA